MGSVISADSPEEIQENVLLKRLSGSESISDNDPYWNKLFSFNFNISMSSREAQRKFSESVYDFLQKLLYNTATTGNFATLIQVFLRRNGELASSVKCENKIFLWQMSNALLIIRHICLFFAQRLSVTEIVNIFEKTHPTQKTQNDEDDEKEEEEANLAEEILKAELCEEFQTTAETFLNSLVGILTEIQINDLTLSIHHQTIRVLLGLLSSQLYEYNVDMERSMFLKYLMRLKKTRATNLVRILLENFLNQNSELSESGEDGKTESLVLSLASSMWSAFQKTVMISLDEEDSENSEEQLALNTFPPQTLGTLSTALLLSLVCYTSFEQKPNVYREMLSLFQNAQEVSSLANLEASFKLDFTTLYNRLCASVHEKLAMLLLYMLMHKNSGFRNFILSRINLENLVLPIIKVLNDGISTTSSPTNSHQTYLALIVLLVLSEDDFFCKIIHETKLKNVNWYQPERPIHEISLGGLIVLVFIRTIHTNTVKTRDRYLHTNSLAALANMASYFKHLSPLVCQKLIGLLETMTRRHTKMLHRMQLQVNEHDEQKLLEKEDAKKASMNEGDEATIDAETTANFKVVQTRNEILHRDIIALEEGIRNVLEIINACLSNNLRYNADLIYSILYKKDLFEIYHDHPMFNDLVWNIYLVINHFTSKVEARTIQSNPTTPTTTSAQSTNTLNATSASVRTVLDVIKKAAIEWPTDRLKKFSELKFKYIEDENTVDFFVPYIWRLIWQTCGIYFAPNSALKLFNLGSHLPSNESTEEDLEENTTT